MLRAGKPQKFPCHFLWILPDPPLQGGKERGKEIFGLLRRIQLPKAP
jgi:hypothetical protein